MVIGNRSSELRESKELVQGDIEPSGEHSAYVSTANITQGMFWME
jgi:hypothetical protein